MIALSPDRDGFIASNKVLYIQSLSRITCILFAAILLAIVLFNQIIIFLPVSCLVFIVAGLVLFWGLLFCHEIDLPNDPRLIAIASAFFYLVSAPLGKRIKYDNFSNDAFSYSYVLVIIGLLGLVVSSLLWKRLPATKVKDKHNFTIDEDIFQTVAIIFVIFGYIFFIINYARIGGYFHGLEMTRVDRMALLSSKRFNIPYSFHIIIGASAYCYGLFFSNRNKVFRMKDNVGRLIILAIMISPICIAWFLEGERSNIIKLFLPLIAIFFFRFPLRFSMKMLVCLIVVFLFLSILGYIRSSIVDSVKQHSYNPLLKRLDKMSLSWLMPREFAASYFSITASVGLNEEKNFGTSYFKAFIMWLPRSLYPGQKPLSLSHEFGAKIAEMVGRSRRFGVGFSPIAEGFINFGAMGPFIVMFFFGFAINWFSQMVLIQGHFFKLLYFNLIPIALFFYRCSFTSCFNFILFNLIVLVTFYGIYLLLSQTPLRQQSS